MAIVNSAEYARKFDDIVSSFRITCFIKDNNGKWVDFSDRLEDNGKNLLVSVGSISLVSEKQEGTGLTSSKAITIQLSNADKFFNSPFPSTLKTTEGSTASFSQSTNQKHSILYNHELQLRISVSFKDGTFEEGILSTYLIGTIKRSRMSPVVQLQLNDKSLPLRADDSAERIKDGLNWYSNRPVKFLLEQALKIRYAKSDNTLPSGFIVPNKVEIQSAGSLAGKSGDQRVLSHYGRQPEIDGSGIWLNKGLVNRAMVVGPTPANLSSAADPPAANPEKKILYMGLDDELWYWNQTNEQSIKIGTTSNGTMIRYLWYSTHQQKIYGVAYNIYTSDPLSDINRHPNGNVRVFKYDGSSISIIADLSNVYLGEFCYRDGRVDTGNNFIGQVSGSESGENVPILYTHRIIDNAFTIFGNPGYGVQKVEKIDSSVGLSAEGYTPEDLEPGYYQMAAIPFSGIGHLRFSFGQKGFFVVNSRSTADIYLWYAVYNTSGETTDFRRINLKTGVDNPVALNVQSLDNAERFDPICGCPDTNSDKVFVGGMAWDDTSGFAKSVCEIKKINPSGAPVISTLYRNSNATGDDQYRTTLEMIHDGSRLVVSLFYRNRIGRNDAFAIATHSDSASANFSSTIILRNPLQGFVKGINGTDINKIYCYEVGTGNIQQYDGSTNTLVKKDDGFPAVDNEYGLSVSELAIDSDTRSGSDILYGTSSPIMLVTEAYTSVPNGKLYLFKYDTFYSGRVALAKTSGMSVWKFVELLAQMSNYKAGFTRGGDFYFVQNAVSSASDFEFRLDDVNKRIIDVVVESGENNVFNFVQVFPSTVFLAPPEWELRLVTRPEILEDDDAQTAGNKKPFDSDIFVQQKDDRRKTIRLECIAGGKISDGKTKMRYRSIDERFETRVGSSYTAGSTSLVITSGIESVRAGDSIRIEGSGNNEETVVASTPTATEKESGTVTLVSGFTNSYAIKDFVEITNNLTAWSDEVDNPITDPFFQNWTVDDPDNWTESGAGDAAKDTTAGLFLFGGQSARLSLTGGTDFLIFEDLPSTNFVASTEYTVSAHLKNFEGDGSFNRTDEMELKVTGAGVSSPVSVTSSSLDWNKVSVTFTTAATAGTVRIEIHIKGTASTKGWVDGVVLKKGVVAELDLILLSNNQFMPIGNSNIEIKFEPQTDETTMLAGDQIIIECPGLDLKKDDNSTRTAINTTSRGLYGEVAYPDINNPFLSRSLARDIAERVVNDFAFPKYKIQLVSPILPQIDFINSANKISSITIYDEVIFEKSGSGMERCQLIAISDGIASGRSAFTLHSLNKE